jgi:hypothetical protein
MKASRIIPYIPVIVLIICGHLFATYDIWNDDIIPVAYVYHAGNFPSVKHILVELFTPHNDHILFVVKLLFGLNYLLLGSINLKWISYLSIIGFIATYFFILKKIKLSPSQKLILSFGMLIPIFYDLFYWALSIQNILVNLFVFLCWHALLNKQYVRSNIFYVAAIFSSSQAMVLLPLGIAYGILKKTNYRVILIPILITIGIKWFASKYVNENPIYASSMLENISVEKLKEAFLVLCPPFNFHFTFYQILLSTALVGILCLVGFDYLKKIKNQTNSTREDFLIGLILYSLGCFVASLFLRQLSEIRYLAYSCTYVPFALIYLTDAYPNVKIAKALAWISILNYAILLFALVEILPDIYLDKIVRTENISRNHSANFFPTDLIRKQSEKLFKKTDFNEKPLFHIPNGINGSVPAHLYIFNEFIGYGRETIQLPNTKTNPLTFVETQVIPKGQIENKPNGQITELLNISVPKKGLGQSYLIRISAPTQHFDFPLSGNHYNHVDDHYSLIVYSNQLPYGKFDVKLVELGLQYSF